MTITDITRSSPAITSAAFAGLQPDLVQTYPVRWMKNQHLLSTKPLEAGKQFHRALQLILDFRTKPTRTERAYLGWVSALRRALLSVGVDQVESERALAACGTPWHGTCDLLVHGGPAQIGVVEAKVIVAGKQQLPRARDLAQLGSYARLAAGRGSFDDVWAATAYIEIESRLVRFGVFRSSRALVARTLDVLRAA